jgi:hypothetical protein
MGGVPASIQEQEERFRKGRSHLHEEMGKWQQQAIILLKDHGPKGLLKRLLGRR